MIFVFCVGIVTIEPTDNLQVVVLNKIQDDDYIGKLVWHSPNGDMYSITSLDGMLQDNKNQKPVHHKTLSQPSSKDTDSKFYPDYSQNYQKSNYLK